MSKKEKKPIDKAVNEKEKFNIVPWLIGIGAILFILVVVFALYFFDNYHHVRKLTYNEETDELYDKKNDITYIRAPRCYETVRLSAKPYAKDGTREYYQLGYLDSEGNEQLVSVTEMLTTSREDGADIYYNPDEVTLPKLGELAADSAFVCDYYNTLDELTRSETKVFVSGYLNGEEALLTSAEEVFTIRLRSSEYPWISYKLELFWNSDLFYVSDPTSDKVIKLPSNVQLLFDKERLSLIASGSKS